MEAEVATYDAAAAAQARLGYARTRLEELQAINADRQRRADEAAAEAARLQSERARLAAGRDAAQQQLDRLSAIANAPTPARGHPSADRLIDAGERLDILSGLQPWRLKATEDGGWLLRFRLGLTARLGFVAGAPGAAAVELAVEGAAAGAPALQAGVLKQLGGLCSGKSALVHSAAR